MVKSAAGEREVAAFPKARGGLLQSCSRLGDWEAMVVLCIPRSSTDATAIAGQQLFAPSKGRAAVDELDLHEA